MHSPSLGLLANPITVPPGGGGVVAYSWESLVGVCRPVLQILTLFQTKKCNFLYPFSDLAFRQKLCYNYIDWSGNKKNHSNPLRSSLENHTRSLNKMGKAYTRLQTKTTQKPYPKGCRNLYSLYKEVSLPRVTVFFMLKMSTITPEYRQLIVTLR